jgi:hypothetical protein
LRRERAIGRKQSAFDVCLENLGSCELRLSTGELGLWGACGVDAPLNGPDGLLRQPYALGAG